MKKVFEEEMSNASDKFIHMGTEKWPLTITLHGQY